MSKKYSTLDYERIHRQLQVLMCLIVAIPILLLTLIFFLGDRFASSGTPFGSPGMRDEARSELEILPWQPVDGQRLYVPAYSHVYHQNGEPYLLTVTLNIRNTDETNAIVISDVRYYDTGGKELRKLIKKPLQLAPLAATEFVIKRDDREGGSGASFIVEWNAGKKVNSPLVETVNVDTSSGQGLSFVVPAIVLQPAKD